MSLLSDKLPLLSEREGLAAATAAVAALAVLVAAVTATTLVTAAAATVVLGVELLGGSVAHELHKAAVAHGLTGQLVIEVHEHLGLSNICYKLHKTYIML